MHGRRRQKGEPRMPVRVVGVVKAGGTPTLGVREVVESLRIGGRVPGGLELRFGEGIVIADPWSRQRPDDAEVLIQNMEILRRWDTDAIAVRGQLACNDAMAVTGRPNEVLRQCGGWGT